MPYLILTQDTRQPVKASKRCEGVWKIYADEERYDAEAFAARLRDPDSGVQVQVVRVPWPRKGWK